MHRYACNLMICLAVLGVFAAPVSADLAIDWYTVDGGGDMRTTGGTFELSGSIGQPDAGLAMSGGTFELSGGFWTMAVEGRCGDLDHDGDVDLGDFELFSLCLAGPFNPPGSRCRDAIEADCDGDGDVDLDDFAGFQAAFTGSAE